MDWYQILIVVGIPSLISGIAIILINRALKARDEKQEIIKKQNEELEKQSKAMMLGVQALLQDRLLQGYKHYEEKGWAGYEDRTTMENMYTQYHSLGKNGVMDQYRERFLMLPQKKLSEGGTDE